MDSHSRSHPFSRGPPASRIRGCRRYSDILTTINSYESIVVSTYRLSLTSGATGVETPNKTLNLCRKVNSSLKIPNIIATSQNITDPR